MEWIQDYWVIVVVGLIAAMFFFGHRGKGTPDERGGAEQHGHADGKSKKGGHSCCH